MAAWLGGEEVEKVSLPWRSSTFCIHPNINNFCYVGHVNDIHFSVFRTSRLKSKERVVVDDISLDF